MQPVRILNVSRPLGRPLVGDYCQRFWCRLRGLAWRRGLPAERALILAYAQAGRAQSAIHMFGMFFDLSIVWLDAEKRVVDLQPAYRWRTVHQPAKAARYVIECALERLAEFQLGDQIAFEEPPRN